jgi:hypothetical protein
MSRKARVEAGAAAGEGGSWSNHRREENPRPSPPSAEGGAATVAIACGMRDLGEAGGSRKEEEEKEERENGKKGGRRQAGVEVEKALVATHGALGLRARLYPFLPCGRCWRRRIR